MEVRQLASNTLFPLFYNTFTTTPSVFIHFLIHVEVLPAAPAYNPSAGGSTNQRQRCGSKMFDDFHYFPQLFIYFL